MLLSFVFVIMGIEFYQEKNRKGAGCVKNLASPRALVIRDGETVRIAGGVVTGDYVVSQEGDRVPADGVILTPLIFQQMSRC